MGDTVTLKKAPAPAPLDGYEDVSPMVGAEAAVRISATSLCVVYALYGVCAAVFTVAEGKRAASTVCQFNNAPDLL